MRDAVPAGELLLCAMQYHMEVHNKMKRVIACLLLVASLLAVCVIGASAQQGKNVIGEIGLYNGNIALDAPTIGKAGAKTRPVPSTAISGLSLPTTMRSCMCIPKCMTM